MYDFTSLVKRHILKFLRDKTAVFFSFLSVLILLALYFLFIGRQYTSSFEGLADNIKTPLMIGVMMGGILVINTVSLSLGVMGNIITDLEYRRLDGFLVTPVKRYKIILSYYLSSIIVTSALTLVMWVLTVFYAGIFAGYWYHFGVIIKVSGLIVFFTFISSSLMIYLTTMLKSVNAFGTLSGVLGTLIGFVSGIYMPLTVLGQSMTYVSSFVPFTHMTILLKNVLLEQPYVALENWLYTGIPNPEQVNSIVENVKLIYGTNAIGIAGQPVHMLVLMGLCLIVSAVLLSFAYRNMNQKMGKR
jgi:multidrug/hemolysin transport system permease protein